MNKTQLALGIALAGLACSQAASALTISGNLNNEGDVNFHGFTLNYDATAAANRRLVIDTLGTSLSPSNDPEIAVYTPGGMLVAEDDDGAGVGFQSQLTFGAGGADGDLAAGPYSVALGGFITNFADGPTVSSTADETGPYDINVNLYETTVNDMDMVLGSGSLASNALESFSFSLVDPILAANGDYLQVDSDGSNFDTELGLYDSTGTHVADNDDFIGLQSLLSFGAGGNDGDLAAGDYTVYLGGWDTDWAPDAQNIVPGNSSGDYVVNFQKTQVRSVLIPDGVSVPEPTTVALFGVGLAGLALRARRRRSA